MKPDNSYLNRLIADTQEKFGTFICPDFDLSSADISYIPTRKRPWMGLRLGLDGMAEMKKYKVKETNKIRSNCKGYQRIYKSDGKIRVIDYIMDGQIARSYIAHYENEYRYLFPFDDKHKNPYFDYIIVSRFENERVTEEYMVRAGQIIYEKYGEPKDGRIGYYYINYIPMGQIRILREAKGYFLVHSLEYVEEEKFVWA